VDPEVVVVSEVHHVVEEVASVEAASAVAEVLIHPISNILYNLGFD